MCPRTMCPRAHVRTCARAHVPRAPGFGWKHNRLKSYFFSEKKPRRVFVKNLVALPFSIRERLQTRQETMAAEDGDDQRGVKPTDKKKCSKWWWFVIMFETEAQALAWAPPATPQFNYACWRPHAAPSTGKPHVHCLMNFKSAQPFKVSS